MEEATGVVTGEALAYFSKRRLDVPEWARLNAFAHRDLQQLRLKRSWSYGAHAMPDAEDSSPMAWRWAEENIAQIVHARAGQDAPSLSRMQAEVLIPLELELMIRTVPLGPLRLTARVREELSVMR